MLQQRFVSHDQMISGLMTLAPVLTKLLAFYFFPSRSGLMMFDGFVNFSLGLLLWLRGMAYPFSGAVLTSLVGCYVCCQSMFPLMMLRGRRDFMDEPSHIYIYSRLVSGSGVLLVLLSLFSTGSSGLLSAITALTVFDLLMNAQLYYKSGCHNSSVERATWTNRLLRLEGFLSLIQALVFFLYPNGFEVLAGGWTLTRMSPLVKLCGCLLLGRSFQSSQSVSLLFETDKRTLFGINMTSGLLEILTIELGRFVHELSLPRLRLVFYAKILIQIGSYLVAGATLQNLRKQAAAGHKEH